MARESPRRQEESAGTQLRTLKETHLLSYFQSTCDGFEDTLQLLQTELPGGPSYKLYKDLVCNEFDYHNALADAEALAKIMTHLNITEKRILNHSMTTVSGVNYIQPRKRILKNLKSFKTNCVDLEH